MTGTVTASQVAHPDARPEAPPKVHPEAPSATSGEAVPEAVPEPAPEADARRAAPARLVVVEGHGDARPPTPQALRRARIDRLRGEAGWRAAQDQLPYVGALLAATAPLPLLLDLARGPALPAALWGTAAVLLGAWLVLGRRLAAKAQLAPSAQVLGALALVAALMTVPAWNDSVAGVGPWLAVASAFAVATAMAASPAAWAVPLAALPAPLAGAAHGLPGLALGLGAGGLALAAGWQSRRRWRRLMLTRLELAERLEAAEAERDAALRADRDKTRFVAIASHDLRQPVHAIGLFAATLHKRLAHGPDDALARNLMRSVDGLERSFSAMLDISRLDSGTVSPSMQTFALRDIFRRLQMQYGGQAELAGLALRFAPGGRSVSSDPPLLERIVGNLVQNAIRYTACGGVAVLARRTRTHVNIEVWDTGSGIRAEELPRIFDEFYQVGRGERDRSQGLGMGLAIVKRLAALLGHRLEVASTPGRGTMFRIGVPIGELAELTEETAAADTLPMTVDVPQMVLVIDDEEPIREGLRLLLLEWGYQCMTAADAAQAERAVSALEGQVDLVLTDLHLGPGAGGREVVATVRRLCAREVPAILVTGDTAGEALREVVAGHDPVLFKPVQPRQLFEAMRAALQ
ncbi:MAG: response regulator [Burkholderiales bacterium]|nr:response regulator [Burkholderiales bacterium]